jgi:branched-chain amino acid transport system permease protein
MDITYWIFNLIILAVIVYSVYWVYKSYKTFTWVDWILLLFRLGLPIFLLMGMRNTIVSGKYSTDQWVSLIISGLAQGSIYALIALGYTLVYGILLMINFAHGDVFMAGAFCAYFVANALAKAGFWQSNPVVAIAITIAVAALVSMSIAVTLEKLAYRPLRSAPRLNVLITAIGASFVIQYLIKGFFGSAVRAYPEVAPLKTFMPILGAKVPLAQLVVLLIAMILMGLLYLLVEQTKMGKAMRAVSENKEVARLMGIDVNQVIAFTFAIGGALAGAAGVIEGLYSPQGVTFTMGFFPGVKAFTAAVLGGIGNIPGAMLGGLVLGVFESLGPNLVLGGLGIPSANQLKDAIAFLMLVMVLIFRPSGILGEKLSEKKA